MKPTLIFGILVLSFVSFSNSGLLAQQGDSDPLENQYRELQNTLSTLSNRSLSDDFEFTRDQSKQVSRLYRRLRDAEDHFDDSTDRGRNKTNIEFYSKRFKEDMALIQADLSDNILLPHQVEVLGKVQKRIQLEWHFQTQFKYAKGTSMDGLELTEQQTQKLAEIQRGFREKYLEEKKRFDAAIKKLKTEAIDELRSEMTTKQKKLLAVE